tara:strand:+ start:670 stop:1299 length:630 start_codon:yes stop_codon:yes gene_type:complete
MAFQLLWYNTQVNDDIINIISDDLKLNFDNDLTGSKITDKKEEDHRYRKSKNAWIPSNHWTAGFIWHYVMKANKSNFNYDIERIDHECMQYTHYGEGSYYHWHVDGGIETAYKPVSGERTYNQEMLMQDHVVQNSDLVRKLSFVLQLSNPEDYDGGELQIEDSLGGVMSAPKTKGIIIFFDSRTRHRVSKVTRGLRKSLVGWVVGPMWK